MYQLLSISWNLTVVRRFCSGRVGLEKMSSSRGPNAEDEDDIVILNSDDEDLEVVEDLDGQREGYPEDDENEQQAYGDEGNSKLDYWKQKKKHSHVCDHNQSRLWTILFEGAILNMYKTLNPWITNIAVA